MIPNFIQALENIILHRLPGEQAHLDLIPGRLKASLAVKKGLKYRQSAVAILLFEENNIWKTVLIERPVYEGSHSGQMAFPGGKTEKFDENIVATALREMQEEIGFEDENIMHLGALTSVYIPVSQFMVFPQVFYTHKRPDFIADKREVASIVTFPLFNLLNPNRLLKKDILIDNGRTLKGMSYFDIENKVVWGATCLILNELKLCLQQVG